MFLVYLCVVHQYVKSYYSDLPFSTPLPTKSNQNTKQDTHLLKDKMHWGKFQLPSTRSARRMFDSRQVQHLCSKWFTVKPTTNQGRNMFASKNSAFTSMLPSPYYYYDNNHNSSNNNNNNNSYDYVVLASVLQNIESPVGTARTIMG